MRLPGSDFPLTKVIIHDWEKWIPSLGRQAVEVKELISGLLSSKKRCMLKMINKITQAADFAGISRKNFWEKCIAMG